MPLQYLPDSIRTIFIKAAAAFDDALSSHGFKETEINWQFDISQLLLQTASLQGSVGLERDFSFLCSTAPVEPQPFLRQCVVVPVSPV